MANCPAGAGRADRVEPHALQLERMIDTVIPDHRSRGAAHHCRSIRHFDGQVLPPATRSTAKQHGELLRTRCWRRSKPTGGAAISRWPLSWSWTESALSNQRA